ncbi:MAG: flagellar assembly protein FliX [Alphaproteobacteria bacterium]|nr:flagellar assembly protein FliX [Alphaproteobacteria bacterium]
MKVDPTGTAKAASVRRPDKGSQAKPGEFSKLLEGLDEPEAPRATAAAAPVDPVVGVRDATDRSGRRSKQRAEDILDRLEEIRLGLLAGAIPRDRLEALDQLVQQHRDRVADPRLSEILDEIELRARVELAKLDMSV